MTGPNVYEAQPGDENPHSWWHHQRENDGEENRDPVPVQWWHWADKGDQESSNCLFYDLSKEQHCQLFSRTSTQTWARCTQRWAFCSPATGPARCPRPSRCFHRLPSLFISCLFTWPRPAIRWRNPQFRNWEQLLYLTEPEKWSAAAMYQVIGYISQHSSLICSVLPFAVMISLDQNSWWF